MDRLTIRLECIKAAALAFSSNVQYRNRTKLIIETAEKFEQYIVGPRLERTGLDVVPDHLEVAVVHDPQGKLLSSRDDFPVDLTGYTLCFEGKPAHVHQPRQHRDRKPPWCDHCGLTAHLLVPKPKIYPQHEFVPSMRDLLICADCELPKKEHIE